MSIRIISKEEAERIYPNKSVVAELFGNGIEDSIEQQSLLNSPTSASGVLSVELIDEAIKENKIGLDTDAIIDGLSPYPQPDTYPQSRLFENPDTLAGAETSIRYDSTGKPSTITTMANWPKNLTVYQVVRRVCDETGNDYHEYVQQLKRMANDQSNPEKAFQAKRVLKKLEASKPKTKQKRKKYNGAKLLR